MRLSWKPELLQRDMNVGQCCAAGVVKQNLILSLLLSWVTKRTLSNSASRPLDYKVSWAKKSLAACSLVTPI